MSTAKKIKQYLLTEDEAKRAEWFVEALRERQETPFALAAANSLEKILVELKAYGVGASAILVSKDLEENLEAKNFAMMLRVAKSTLLSGLKSV